MLKMACVVGFWCCFCAPPSLSPDCETQNMKTLSFKNHFKNLLLTKVCKTTTKCGEKNNQTEFLDLSIHKQKPSGRKQLTITLTKITFTLVGITEFWEHIFSPLLFLVIFFLWIWRFIFVHLQITENKGLLIYANHTQGTATKQKHACS